MLVAPLYLPVCFCLYKHAASKFFGGIDIFSQNVVAKSTKSVDVIRFAWNNAQAINTHMCT